MRHFLFFALFTSVAPLGACSQADDFGPLDGGGTGGTAGRSNVGGSGGNVGGSGGNVGGSGGGQSCGATLDQLRTFYASATRGPDVDISVNAYEGSAIVETSTAEQLALTFEQDAKGGAKVIARTMIVGSLPLPLLPIGAKVWLAQTPLVRPFAFGPWAQTMSIRDGEGGTLLLGSAKDLMPPFDEPISVRSVAAGCSEPNQDPCFRGTTVTHQEVEITGDTTVKIVDRHAGSVGIGGLAYDVSVFAQTVSGVTTVQCGDAYQPYGVSLGVIAHDLAPLIAGLEIVEPPASP